MVELESLSYIFLFENKPYDAVPVRKFRRMDLDMDAGKLLCAILFGIIDQIVTSAEILVMAEYDVLVCRRQVFLYPFHLLAQRMRIAPWAGRQNIYIKILPQFMRVVNVLRQPASVANEITDFAGRN